jgi:hypothetical protein
MNSEFQKSHSVDFLMAAGDFLLDIRRCLADITR